MTRERFKQLGAIFRWHAEQSQMIYRSESAQGWTEYSSNPEARRVLMEWLNEKLEAVNMTTAESDEYDMIVEGEAEAAASRWEDDQR